MTAPWQARAETDLRHAVLSMPVTVTYRPITGAPIPLGVTAGRVTFDEGWAPHVQADLTVTAQSDALVDALDPRTLGRIEITAGYRYPGATAPDIHLLADLGLRTREAERTADGTWLMHLTAASDEALVQDAGYLVGDPWYSSPLPATQAITFRLTTCLGRPTTIVSTVTDVLVDPTIEDFIGETTQWDRLLTWAGAAEGQLIDRGDRTWLLRPWQTRTTPPTCWLETGPGGTITRASQTISRDAWASYVTVIRRWRDIASEDHQTGGWAAVADGPYRSAADTFGNPAPGIRSHVIQLTTPGTGDALIDGPADTALARETLTRLLRAGHTENITARAAWWVRPSHTVMVRTGPDQAWRPLLVSRVTFDLTDASMSLDLRHPDDSTIT